MIIDLKKYRAHTYFNGSLNILKKMFLSLNQPLFTDLFSVEVETNNYHYYPSYKIDVLTGLDLCTSCGICSDVCPVDVIKLVDQDDGFSGMEMKAPGKFQIDLSHCIKCGLCVLDCPEEALVNNGSYSAQQVSQTFTDIKKIAQDTYQLSYDEKSK
jgi:formate hydrogenlyase subunit 6/NADH:ubiquinone oxidoreductase subunit I